MSELSGYLAKDYKIVSSHGGSVSGHFLVLQKGTSVVIAYIPGNALTGEVTDRSVDRMTFTEVSK